MGSFDVLTTLDVTNQGANDFHAQSEYLKWSLLIRASKQGQTVVSSASKFILFRAYTFCRGPNKYRKKFQNAEMLTPLYWRGA